jgi:acyl-CoA hydrolase
MLRFIIKKTKMEEEIEIQKKRELRVIHAIHSFTVFPEDLNYKGSLFGGKILAEMDIAGIKPIRRMLYMTDCDNLVTARIDRVDFLKPANLGDLIEMTATIFKLGTTSISVYVNVTKEDETGLIEKICDASLVYVALKNNKPHPHNHYLPANVNTQLNHLFDSLNKSKE